ncbi:hypothetical protein HCZ30_13590 [Marivivens donghaensis]|uniref:Uncharacterized protein n=1 Tax=Marivivens donghaensis TaxID=1699413 RepID=A0ABX0W050_9RHOB|nr:hypothetical protein [Marivivens donghaensis]NIY73459.1 hypothetical protein [Marivivens donghaensis]
MNSVSQRFFAFGALCALIGMAWGIVMSATGDHSLSPAHGHLNLIGFVASSVFGAYYALSPSAAASKLSNVHFWLAVLSVIVIVPGIVMALTEQGETLAKVGSILTILSMLLFFVTVLRNRVGG